MILAGGLQFWQSQKKATGFKPVPSQHQLGATTSWEKDKL